MKQNQNYRWPKLELGACYYPEHWSESLWESDLDRMLQHGITTIRVGEFAWSLTEPEEGVFTYDFWDRFLELAEEKGMKVIFGTPTATPPAWLTEKYPEVLNARRDGVLYRHGTRRHYNYNSPKYRELSSRIVEKLAQHYAQRSCIVGWQVDNEFNCETQEFYSESDNVAFREFLRAKYGTLDALNQAWGAVFWNQTYTDWEQVHVPRTTYGDGTNPNQKLDYIRFVSHSTLSFCEMQVKILRKYCKPGDFITTNGIFGSMDNHKLTREILDVYTYDSYPNFAYAMDADPRGDKNLRDRKWSRNLMEVRSICPHFGIMEQQAGTGGSATMSAPAPKPGQMMLWVMQSVAHGAEYVSFFRWRTATFGTEMYWHGLVDYDNRPNRKLAELQRLNARMQAIQELAGTDYVAPVGMVKDYDNIFDTQTDAWHQALTRQSEQEIFVGCQLAHTPLDAVYLQEGMEAKELRETYPVLFCPHQEILSPENAQLLEEYARLGGTLILGARTGQKDVLGHCVMQPVPGLLTGAAGTQVVECTFIGPGDDPVPMVWEGKELPTGIFNEVLEPVSPETKVLARFGGDTWYAGEPALTCTPVGNGRVFHLGGCFTRETVETLLKELQVYEPFQDRVTAPAACEIALRRKGDQDYLVVLNYEREPQEIVLNTAMVDLDTRCQVQGPVELGSYETKVYRIL